MTVLYRRPTGYKDVHAEWTPDDKQAGAEALAAVIDDVPDATTAVDQAPHDLDQVTAAAIRDEYAALVEGGGS